MTSTGFCFYCGQAICDISAESQDDADRQATLQCSCSEAQARQKKERKKDEAKIKIRALFYEEEESTEEVADMVIAASELMVDKKIKAVTVAIPCVGIVKMALGARGEIKIEKRKTISSRETVED